MKRILTWEEQAYFLSNRGMKVSHKNIDKLKTIGYYRIKEFAKPFSKVSNIHGKKIITYREGTTFDEIVTRYYQDKNLRINIFHSLESIEVTLKTQMSHILANKRNMELYGYLDFKNWTNREFPKKYIEKQETRIKKNIRNAQKRSNSLELRNKDNLNEEGYPTIFLGIKSLMFDDLIVMLKIMNKNSLRKISKYFGCTAEELVSWLKCLKFVRNVCVHNDNLIDIKLGTTPIYRNSWLNYLYIFYNNDDIVTNRLAIIVMIIITLSKNINVSYRWNNIQSNLKSHCNNNDFKANILGFKNSNSCLNLKNISKNI